jgi:prepilin-type processing-associated H-X9-DG protein/prepilin-type N-terminal cleavage/methylation domain-containing protein
MYRTGRIVIEGAFIMKNKAFPHASTPRCRHSKSTSGFTVVEMLIVIAIMGLLAALLFPVFARAREAARGTACISNLKQLGQAFQQYSTDNGRRYPLAAPFLAWGNGGHWVSGTTGSGGELADLGSGAYIDGRTANVENGAIYSYVKSTGVYVCPSNQDGKKKRLSYSMNCALSAISDVRIRQPSDIVLLIDEEKANDGYFFAVDDGPVGNTTGGPSGSMVSGASTNSTDALTTIHNGGGNLLFCDGHAKPFLAKVFPVDGTPEGKANKWRQTGSPRFHDPAFGKWGSNANPTATVDYCNASKRDP